MRNNLFLILLLFSHFAVAESLIKKTITIEPNKKEIITVKTTKVVSINVSFSNVPYNKTIECGNCLHLSQQLKNGHISQTNSSNYGIGFIKVMPENGVLTFMIQHDYKTPKKVEIEVDTNT